MFLINGHMSFKTMKAGDSILISDSFFSIDSDNISELNSVDNIVAGMELFQGDKHVGKALFWDFGDGEGEVLSVFHSSTKDGQGPVVDRLDDLGNWTHGAMRTEFGEGYGAFFSDPTDENYLF